MGNKNLPLEEKTKIPIGILIEGRVKFLSEI